MYTRWAQKVFIESSFIKIHSKRSTHNEGAAWLKTVNCRLVYTHAYNIITYT